MRKIKTIMRKNGITGENEEISVKIRTIWRKKRKFGEICVPQIKIRGHFFFTFVHFWQLVYVCVYVCLFVHLSVCVFV